MGAGQLEEMIVQAKDELELIPKFAGGSPAAAAAARAALTPARRPCAEWRLWEPYPDDDGVPFDEDEPTYAQQDVQEVRQESAQ